jgi:GR25 family glycosyltransferase involved in LPS biosynthesis
MNCILINLASQPARRERVEANFAKAGNGNWVLSHLNAIDATQVANAGVEGRITPPEKGCFLSHLAAIEAARQMPGPTLVVEDDVLFGEKTFPAVDAVLNGAANLDWDLMFTDICVPDVHTMIRMYLLRRQLAATQELQIIPLDKVIFAGSTSYLVNARSKEKMLALLTENPALDAPYDLTLRKLAYQSRLKAFVIFPFVTSLAPAADASQIQTRDDIRIADLAWNAFRRTVWWEASVAEGVRNLDRIASDYFDPECLAFTRILSCVLAAKFKEK